MGYRVAILGATGAVGREMMKVLEERNFPIDELRVLASARSVGKKLPFKGGEVTVQEANENAFGGIDIVLGATSNAVTRQLAPAIRAAGAVLVDNSSAFRMDPAVPLVVPEINPEDIFTHNGIIANPNCSTIITLTAVNALHKISPIQTMVASTYQAVSGAGAGGPVELAEQVQALEKGEEARANVFQHQIAYNLIPQIGSFNEDGYSTEEMKMQNEGRKILHQGDLAVSCTCVRVPVVRSHSISVQLVTERAVSVAEAREAIAAAPGCVLKDDIANGIYPMPLETSDQDLVFVGRIRKDLTHERGLCLWCCGDQVRKGAATNAIQIAEKLIENR